MPGAYAAFGHTLTEAPAPLTLIGLGLLIGQNGIAALKCAWLAFFPAMMIGIAATLHWGAIVYPEIPLMLIAIVTGLLAASCFKLTRASAVGIGLAAGYFLGVFSAPGPASWSTTAYMSSGALLAANLMFVYLSIIIDAILQRWSITWILLGFQIVGSWVVAISFLLLALFVRR